MINILENIGIYFSRFYASVIFDETGRINQYFFRI